MLDNVLFMAFVAIAVYTQNLTGFALALVLLGLVGAFDIIPLTDAVNVVNIIALVNAGLFLHRRRALRLARILWPALAASLAGTVVGVVALVWLASSAYEVLRLILGVSIVLCAWTLWRSTQPLAAPSSPRAFVAVGALSGLMSGLFSAGGPPLVYQFYRQPWPLARIQESLVFFFGATGLLRLLTVIPTGAFTVRTLELAAMGLPVVVGVTLLTARRPPPFRAESVRRIVCLLLVLAGATMAIGAGRAIGAA